MDNFDELKELRRKLAIVEQERNEAQYRVCQLEQLLSDWDIEVEEDD